MCLRKDDAVAQKEASRLSGIAYVAAKRGGLFTGPLPVSTGAFLFQLEGHRMVACVSAMECIGLLTAFQGDPDALSEVSPDMAPDMMKEPRHLSLTLF